MTVAEKAAPHIDRLVLSVNGAQAWNDLEEAGHDAGLDSLDFILHWWDFLLAGVLTPETAHLRSRYRTPEEVEARLDELADKGLIRSGPTGWMATSDLVPLLEGVGGEQRRVATSAWQDHGDTVDELTTTLDELIASATDEHVVAVVHRQIPRPDDPFHGLHHRLVTMRFIRQHDHAMAWTDKDLTAQQMLVMTPLWNGEVVDGAPSVIEELRANGYVEGSALVLSERGQEVRDAIEAETNRRAQVSFAILDDTRGANLLRELEGLPSA